MQEGRATPSQVDAVMRDTCGFRMGPFELMDLTGIDVNFPARKIIYEGFFHDRRMTPSPYHESLYAAGKLGRKTGGGWYAYDDKGAKIDAGADHPTSHVPASSVVIMDTHNKKLLSLVSGDGANMLAADDGKSPILVAPIGKDCTTTAIELGLDPKRTVAVDLTGDVSKRITIMMAPGFDPAIRDATVALLAKSGTKVTVIKDSPGFIAQRMCSMIANLGCEMAMIGIASAADVDTAMTLGLNYPRGPLAPGRLAGRQGVSRDPGTNPGDHRRRPLPSQPVAAPPRDAGTERHDGRIAIFREQCRTTAVQSPAAFAGEPDDEAEQVDGGWPGRAGVPDRRRAAGPAAQGREPARGHAARVQARLQ